MLGFDSDLSSYPPDLLIFSETRAKRRAERYRAAYRKRIKRVAKCFMLRAAEASQQRDYVMWNDGTVTAVNSMPNIVVFKKC